MRTVLEHIRRHLEKQIYYNAPRIPSSQELWDSQWNDEFDDIARRRMVMGAFRHGLKDFSNPDTSQIPNDVVAYIKVKLQAYEDTGNTENLADIRNLAMIEFTWPKHPNAHFIAEDDKNHHE